MVVTVLVEVFGPAVLGLLLLIGWLLHRRRKRRAKAAMREA
jgi:Flp pilus assembly protein TadB